jgi:pilus assembly protein CpaE
MANVAIIETLPSALVACTISRNIEEFELLIDEMEGSFGESWGDIPFAEAAQFLTGDDAPGLEFMVIAVNAADEDNLPQISQIIALGKQRGIGVILLTDALGPAMLHKLMRSGADDFLPYPLPDDAFDEAIARLQAAREAAKAPPPPAAIITPPPPLTLRAKTDRDGVVLPVHGFSGGVGASTLAVNLAHEMALIAGAGGARVCVLDFDFQFGNVATYLDLPRRDAVLDFLSDAALADSEAMLGAMQTTKDGLNVLTSPADMMPLELISPTDAGHIIDMARANFDYVIIDMPTAIVSWTEAVLTRAHVYFAVIELDLRSAQNVLRLLRALKAEGLPYEKLRYALNRAPGFTDLAAKARVRRMAESLDIAIELQLPDGGAAIAQANDQGLPLASAAAKNPLRRDIQKLAKSLIDVNTAATTAKR